MLFDGKSPGATIMFPTYALAIEFENNVGTYIRRNGNISFRELRTIAKLNFGVVKKLRSVGGNRFTSFDICFKRSYHSVEVWFPDENKGETHNEP